MFIFFDFVFFHCIFLESSFLFFCLQTTFALDSSLSMKIVIYVIVICENFFFWCIFLFYFLFFHFFFCIYFHQIS